METDIPFVLAKDFFYIATGGSTPSFMANGEPPFIKKGETTTIVRTIAPHPSNPLYSVQNAKGKRKAIYRDNLVEHGVTFYP